MFEKSIYSHDPKLERIDKEIKKNLFPIAIKHPELDFTSMWILFYDSFDNVTYDMSSQPMNEDLRSKINFIIGGTIAIYPNTLGEYK